MSDGQILILDCHAETRPVICFNLEVAGFQMRVVTDEDEAINLLDNARLTEENFTCLLVNNPYLNIDISKIIEEVQKIGIDIPVVFVKDSDNLKKIIEALSIEQKFPRIYHAVPIQVAELMVMLFEQASGKSEGRSTAIQSI